MSSSGYGWQVTLTDIDTERITWQLMSSATATTVVASAAVAVANGDVIQYYASFQNPASAILWQQDFYALTHADSHLTGLGVMNFTDYPQEDVAVKLNHNPHSDSQYGYLSLAACLSNLKNAYKASQEVVRRRG